MLRFLYGFQYVYSTCFLLKYILYIQIFSFKEKGCRRRIYVGQKSFSEFNIPKIVFSTSSERQTTVYPCNGFFQCKSTFGKYSDSIPL